MKCFLFSAICSLVISAYFFTRRKSELFFLAMAMVLSAILDFTGFKSVSFSPPDPNQVMLSSYKSCFIPVTIFVSLLWIVSGTTISFLRGVISNEVVNELMDTSYIALSSFLPFFSNNS